MNKIQRRSGRSITGASRNGAGDSTPPRKDRKYRRTVRTYVYCSPLSLRCRCISSAHRHIGTSAHRVADVGSNESSPKDAPKLQSCCSLLRFWGEEATWTAILFPPGHVLTWATSLLPLFAGGRKCRIAVRPSGSTWRGRARERVPSIPYKDASQL